MTEALDHREIFRRYPGNPILTPASWPNMVNAVFNPGAVMYDGETLLVVRVEDRTGMSRLAVVTSRNGYDGWVVERDRSLAPDPLWWAEKWGVEDARISMIDGRYYLCYTGYSSAGPLVCMAATDDFRTFEKLGVMHVPENKDAALFPRRVRGRWAMIHRPVSTVGSLHAHIWLSWSTDLLHWGEPTPLIYARDGGWWDANKVGIGPPPLETQSGWLVLYHGVRLTAAGSLYRLGLALLDLDDPTQVIARGDEWVFGPCAPYEIAGDVPDVVFPCGWVLDPDGDTLRMYYGAADSCVAVATASLSDLLRHLAEHSTPAVLGDRRDLVSPTSNEVAADDR